MNKFPDWKAAERHYNRQHFRDLRKVTFADCCHEWQDACWAWLNHVVQSDKEEKQ